MIEMTALQVLPPIPSWSELHPLVIHFPIALLLVAPIFILGAVFTDPKKGRPFLLAALVLMILGTARNLLSGGDGRSRWGSGRENRSDERNFGTTRGACPNDAGHLQRSHHHLRCDLVSTWTSEARIHSASRAHSSAGFPSTLRCGHSGPSEHCP